MVQAKKAVNTKETEEEKIEKNNGNSLSEIESDRMEMA
jgi:hypothetical protein